MVSNGINSESREREPVGVVLWFTGLSGAGKTTLARALERDLLGRGLRACVLDGDELRQGLCSDLGFSQDDRAENVRRVAEVARLFARAGFIVVTSLISPSRKGRKQVRRTLTRADEPIEFNEVFLDAPLAVCANRDPKLLYRQAKAGLITEFTGMSSPYEPPESAEVVLRTAELTVDQCVSALIEHLRSHGVSLGSHRAL